MPTYIIRHSPDRREYLLWSTVVDAPTSTVMDAADAVEHAFWDAGTVDADLALRQAKRRLARVDERGTSARDGSHFGYEHGEFWWREDPPDDFGRPYDDEDEPGRQIGRLLTRDELFEACR